MSSTITKNASLSLESLEDREVMSATVGFQHGILDINLHANGRRGETVVVQNRGGLVSVNAGSGTAQHNPNLNVRADDIHVIRVHGSNRGDGIFLQHVNDQAFRNLQKTEIYGYGGHDTIRGSQVGDWIWGHRGNDDIDGQGGNDHIFGGEHDDTLQGGYGSDYIHGQGGNDKLYGAGRNYIDTEFDRLIGGTGFDIVGLLRPNDMIQGIERRR